jgi:hypothetical protein
MSPALLSISIVSAGLAAWILAPLFRSDAVEAERSAFRTSERAELLSRKDQLLAALRDLEDDRETGKMNDRDYRELEAKLTTQTAEILRKLDELAIEDRANQVQAGPSAVHRS